MPQFDITPNTLEHVLALEAGGSQVTDVSLTMMRPTLYRLRLTLRGGDFRDFFHESATGDEVVRLQEAIAAHIRAYGPHTLLESIHREVSQRARSEGCRPADFTVLLSDELFREATPHLPGYCGYGYTFRVATDQPGSWYRIHRITANEA
jgi:hypothetical protein